ncbi:MAG: hypothetical protein JXP73_13370 [Deltaproteobacteria bacterium]|nr:hypothetical protein [Deltaproteobacteria bacterium]
MWLVVAAVLMSVVSVYYYLRVVVAMCFRERTEPASGRASPATAAVLVVLAGVVPPLGVLPGPVPALVQ